MRAKKRGYKVPPKWYLYTVIVLNIISPLMDYFILYKRIHILFWIEVALVGAWLCTNVWMLGELYKTKSHKQAYILPVYYLIFFASLPLFRLFDEPAQIINMIYFYLVSATVIFEISVALIQIGVNNATRKKRNKKI